MSFCLGGETEASGQSHHVICRDSWGPGRQGYLLWDCDQRSSLLPPTVSTAWGVGWSGPHLPAQVGL